MNASHARTRLPASFRRAARVLAGTFAVLVLVVALLFSVFRLVVPEVPKYRGEVEAWASDLLGAPVAIAEMDLRWRGLRPEVVLGHVQYVSGDARLSLAVREMRFGLSYLSLFRARRLAPARIVLVEPDLTWVMADEPPARIPATGWAAALEREDRRGELLVVDGRLVVHTRDGRRVPFDGVNGRARSDGSSHALDMRARVDGVVGRGIRVEGTARGTPGDDDWRSSLAFDAQHIDLPALQALAGLEPVDGGRLDLALRLQVAGREVARVDADVGLAGLDWTPGEQDATRRVDRAAFGLRWDRLDDGWEARLEGYTVHRASGASENGPLVVRYERDRAGAGAVAWRIRGERAWLQDVLLLGVLHPGPDGELLRVTAYAPRGRLNAFELVLRPVPGEPADWTLRASGERLAWTGSERPRVPGVRGLDVAVEGGRDRGSVTLGGDVHGEFPWLFRAPLPGVGVDGGIEWQREADGVRLYMPALRAGNDDIEALHAEGELWWPGARDGARVELTAQFTGVRLTRGSPYLPVSIMPPVLVDWLDDSVRDGIATSGRMTWRGPLAGFPYRDGGGLFEVAFDARSMHIAYDARWPHLEDASARVTFRNQGFFADLDGGSVAGVAVRAATVRLDDYREPVMSIDAGFDDALPVLQSAFLATPVGAGAGDWLARGTTTGEARLDLGLTMPMRDVASTRVEGRLAMREASFSPGGTDLGLSDVSGTLHIDDTAVTADRIAARLFGGPLRIGVADAGTGDGHVTHVLFAGSLDRETLGRAGIELGPGVMTGSATWIAELAVPRSGGRPPTIELSSDLRGVALDLPAPLGKSTGDAWTVTLETVLDAGTRDVHLTIPSRLHASMKVRSFEPGWVLEAASARVGPGDSPPQLPDSGMVLEGWLGSWRVGRGGAVAMPLDALDLHTLDLRIAELEAFGQSLGRTQVSGTRTRAGWHLLFDGERVAGTADLPGEPDMDAPVRLDLERLHLEQALLREADENRLDPRAIPAIAFHVRDFTSGGLRFGEVNGILRPVQDGIALDDFMSTTPTQRIEMEGSWLTDGMHHSTTVRGTVDSTDVRRTLTALGFSASIEASAGHLDGEVSWPDVPHGDMLSSLDGHLLVRIERGTLNEVAPGAGRMFGLLSLNALPRRLSLDFSDVFQRGLGFDTIHGNFRIERGDAYTDDLSLTGPAARIEVTGRTGLAQRDYDQTAVVTGSLASSLTLAGTLAGGPGVGAALLIASELLKASLEDMARVRYRISGDWDSPTVERLPEAR